MRSWEERVLACQGGSAPDREALLSELRAFAARVAGHCLGRSLDWHNDDALSVALGALNEAIDAYRPDAGTSFQTFASTVIRRRLTDHLRKEMRTPTVSLDQDDGPPGETGTGQSAYEVAAAQSAWRQQTEAEERAADIRRLEEILAGWGIRLWDLAHTAPKHQDSRLNLVAAARRWVASGSFPGSGAAAPPKVHQICAATGLSRKTVHHHRAFLLAVAVILADDELRSLRSYFEEGKRHAGAGLGF